MGLPSFLIWYKKPEYRDYKEYSSAIVSGKRTLSPEGRGKVAVPRSLALERVLENKTCSPLSLYDFYMYLKYIEYSPENLEFYIWFKNYEMNYEKNYHQSTVGRGYGGLHMTDSATTLAEENLDGDGLSVDMKESNYDPEIADETVERIAQLISPENKCAHGKSCVHNPKGGIVAAAVEEENVGEHELQKETPTVLRPRVGGQDPFHRAELSAVVQTFLLPEARSELNIPPAMRDEALRALRTSSDPACLQPIADHVYGLLRNCSHRNFVRLGVSNGTYETLCMATSLGIVLTLAGFLTALLLAFASPSSSPSSTSSPHGYYYAASRHKRVDVLAAWPLWWVGLSLILSGLRGSCFFLLLFSRRQPLPWERYDDDHNDDSTLAETTTRKSGFMRFVSRMMIFDRKWKVQDQHLRNLQHRIVVQSIIGGAIFATVGVLIFVFLPVWADPL